MIRRHRLDSGMDKKAEDDELDTLQQLLTVALHAVIAEFLNVPVDRVHPGSRLVADLGMCPQARRRLQRELAFLFDCDELDMPPAMRVEELVAQVAEVEFARR